MISSEPQASRLHGSNGSSLPFLMYPQAQTADGMLDSVDPDSFRDEIAAREVS